MLQESRSQSEMRQPAPGLCSFFYVFTCSPTPVEVRRDAALKPRLVLKLIAVEMPAIDMNQKYGPSNVVSKTHVPSENGGSLSAAPVDHHFIAVASRPARRILSAAPNIF
jgi:hypothetical protein